MEWWVPYAVMAAALVISMIAPMPLPRSRREDAPRRRAVYEYDDVSEEPEPRRAKARPAPEPVEDDLAPPRNEPPRRRTSRYSDDADDDLDDDEDQEPGLVRARSGAPEPEARSDQRRAPAPEPRRAPPPPERPRPAARSATSNESYERRKPVLNRPGVDAVSYFRDPTALADWPQAAVVEETVRAFIDRWGGSKPAATTFRKVEVVPISNERAFAFLLAVEPERRGKETTVLARVCIPGENAERPSRFMVTKYFDHMGERFRQDVAKTPQHSRGIIQVRDVPSDDGRGAVALDFEVPLMGDPYDDIRSDDVTQYKNLLNIMRMFA